MPDFTPVSAAIGGACIGTAASLLLWANGRIAGISGILGGALGPGVADRGWRLVFLAGLLIGSGIALSFTSQPGAGRTGLAWPVIAVAGLLVGFGTRLGSGCTSGHGICGIARLSRRSLVATACFMASGAVTVFIVRRYFGA